MRLTLANAFANRFNAATLSENFLNQLWIELEKMFLPSFIWLYIRLAMLRQASLWFSVHICSMVLEYLPTFARTKWHVGKYTIHGSYGIYSLGEPRLQGQNFPSPEALDPLLCRARRTFFGHDVLRTFVLEWNTMHHILRVKFKYV